MTFDYNTLKRAARDGSRLGNWNGKAVFAASAADLENRGNGAFYVLYDDENKLVTKINGAWKSYGEVSAAGSVHEYSNVRNYKIPAIAQVKFAAMPQAKGAGGSYSPGYDRAERPVGDVKTEIDVEKTLKMARKMSIEDLLEGFLTGVDFSVEKG